MQTLASPLSRPPSSTPTFRSDRLSTAPFSEFHSGTRLKESQRPLFNPAPAKPLQDRLVGSNGSPAYPGTSFSSYCTHLSGLREAPSPGRWLHPREPRGKWPRWLPPATRYVSVAVSGRQGLGWVPGEVTGRGRERTTRRRRNPTYLTGVGRGRAGRLGIRAELRGAGHEHPRAGTAPVPSPSRRPKRPLSTIPSVQCGQRVVRTHEGKDLGQVNASLGAGQLSCVFLTLQRNCAGFWYKSSS